MRAFVVQTWVFAVYFLVKLYIYNPPFLLWFLHPVVLLAPSVQTAPDPPEEQNKVISVSCITATWHWVPARSALFSVKGVWKKSMLAPVTFLWLIKNKDPMHKEWSSFFPFFMALLDYMILELFSVPGNHEVKRLLMWAAWVTSKYNEMHDHTYFMCVCVENIGFDHLWQSTLASPFYKW